MFSLLKIPYCPKVVANIATLNNNIEMVEYLINKYEDIKDDDELCQNIGFIGNEYLLNKLTDTGNLSSALVGICEGSHIDLFEKYKDVDYYVYDMVKKACKIECDDMLHTIMNNIISINFTDAKINGRCARKNANQVFEYIKNLIDRNKIKHYIPNICEGLLEGGHYDIYKWFLGDKIDKSDCYNKNIIEELIKTSNCKINTYECFNDEIIKNIIRHNDYKMFTYILSNNCKNIWVDYTGRMMSATGAYLDYRELVQYCIDYRRKDMLKFLINYVMFNIVQYQKFLDRAKLFRFDDIYDILILNAHLFKEYKFVYV
jgi:hypothetical protein